MIRNIIFLIMSLLATASFGQNFTECYSDLNPEFITATKSNNQSAYFASPMQYKFDNLPTLRTAEVLPTSYDLRTKGILLPVRNQAGANTCWSFVTMNAIQSSWALAGLQTEAYSPENMANCHGFDKVKDDGGTSDMAIAYLSRFAGPVFETSDPYITTTAGSCSNSITRADKAGVVSEALKLPNSINTIKHMVYKYGGVFTAMNSLSLINYYNNTTHAVYAPDKTVNGAANHAGLIVGWDDNFVVNTPNSTASNPGAWIVRNTYGPTANDNGYYYASYEDAYIGAQATVFTKRIDKELIDTVYFYDKLGAITSKGAVGVDSAFTLSKFTSNSAQTINHIGVYTISANTTVDIDIYQSKSGETLTTTLGSSKENLIEYPGYHTIPINANINGDFYVKVKYSSPGNSYPIPIEVSSSNYSTIDLKPAGLQWYKFAEGMNWLDARSNPTKEYNISLKVYATNNTKSLAFSNNKNRLCGNDSITFYNNSIGSYDSYEWNFGTDATPQTAITNSVNDTISVKYSSSGTKTIVLKGIAGGITDSITIINEISITSGVPLQMSTNIDNNSPLENTTFNIYAAGANEYLWLAPASLTNQASSTVTITAGETAFYAKVQANINECYTTDSIYINVLECPCNDINVAQDLSLGIEAGPFTNKCANAETNEPVPPATDCISQTGWCIGEDVIENSLWFKFTAPASGKVKITTRGGDTSGFDNQIALYDAKSTGTYADLISGNPSDYELLAANDDTSDSYFSATIESANNLSPGKTYWIQLDGSYQGTTTDLAYITVSDANISSYNENDLAKIKISNPARNGMLAIRNADKVKTINITSIMGSELKRYKHDGSPTFNANLQDLQEGIYIIRIETDNKYTVERVILTK